MRRNAARIAVVMLVMLAGAGATLAAGAGAAQTAGQSAPPAETPFIAFVKKVLAAAPGEFSPLKGAEDDTLGKDHTMFHGTLTPDAATTCKLFTRRGNKMENPPLYSCNLASSLALTDAKPVYEKAAADLRAAFPNWKFREEKSGDESKREEAWSLTAVQPGFTVALSLSDFGLLADLLSGKSSGNPGVFVTLDVTDTLPEKEKPKTAAALEMTANLPLCKFIEKVRAARQKDYAALRSARPAETNGAIPGTLRPDALSTCKVYPPKSAGNNKAFYLCELRRAKTMEEIKPEYERLKTELQACYSNLKFDESINDSEGGRADTWFYSGKDALYQLTVEASDEGYMLKTDPEKVDAKTKQAPVSLVLQIQFLQ
jgi:hypothetical protein